MPIRALLLLAAALLLLAPAPAGAQIPDEVENLQLLDPEISKPLLLETMKAWTAGLGVRCSHCHVGPDNLQGMDFASDEKATKRTARRMLEMVRSINGPLLAGLPVNAAENGGDEHAQVVSCHTCHRGAPTPPRPIRAVLADTARDEGAGAALEIFAELRREHRDAGRYDLRPAVLFHFARDLMSSGDAEAALATLDALHGIAPKMGDAYALRAQIEIGRDRLDEAERLLAEAREVDPEARLANWVAGLLVKAKEKSRAR